MKTCGSAFHDHPHDPDDHRSHERTRLRLARCSPNQTPSRYPFPHGQRRVWHRCRCSPSIFFASNVASPAPKPRAAGWRPNQCVPVCVRTQPDRGNLSQPATHPWSSNGSSVQGTGRSHPRGSETLAKTCSTSRHLPPYRDRSQASPLRDRRDDTARYLLRVSPGAASAAVRAPTR